jgi:hypothetical protein
MPRKTRQEKMAAALRRLKKQAQTSEESTPTTPKVKEPKQDIQTHQGYSLDKIQVDKPSVKPPPRSETARYDYTYVFNDLKTIVFLSILAIGLEILLNLTMRLEFAKLLLRRFGIDT